MIESPSSTAAATGSHPLWTTEMVEVCVVISSLLAVTPDGSFRLSPGRSPGLRVVVPYRPSLHILASGNVGKHSPHTVAGAAAASNARFGSVLSAFPFRFPALCANGKTKHRQNDPAEINWQAIFHLNLPEYCFRCVAFTNDANRSVPSR